VLENTGFVTIFLTNSKLDRNGTRRLHRLANRAVDYQMLLINADAAVFLTSSSQNTLHCYP
jgi:hypothetical protein